MSTFTDTASLRVMHPIAAHPETAHAQSGAPESQATNAAAAATTESHCSANDRDLTKLARWLAKLDRDDAIQAYNLKDPRELAVVCRKYLGMVSTLRRLIDEEWIEEWPAASEKNKDHSGHKHGPNDTCGQQHQQHEDADGEVSRPLEPLMEGTSWTLPSLAPGLQRDLSVEFPLVTYASADIPERKCEHCSKSIWNRGWQCKETISKQVKGAPAVQHHSICNACYAVGGRCTTNNHHMVMVQRFSMSFLMNTYTKAVEKYNTLLVPLQSEVGVTLGQLPDYITHFVRFDEKGNALDDPKINNPRPAAGRNAATICYFLFLRHHLPLIFCHQCKSRRYPNEIITCDDAEHVKSMVDGGSIRSKNGFYYCYRCLINRYGEQCTFISNL